MRADIQCFNCGHDAQAEWCFCPTCGEALAIAAILSEALAAPDCQPIVYNAPGVPASGQAERDVPDVAIQAATIGITPNVPYAPCSTGYCNCAAKDAKIAALQTELAAKDRENAELQQKLARSQMLNRQATCTYCGHQSDLNEDRSDLSSKIAEHVRNCPKHPLNRVQEVVAAATAEAAVQSEYARQLTAIATHQTRLQAEAFQKRELKLEAELAESGRLLAEARARITELTTPPDGDDWMAVVIAAHSAVGCGVDRVYRVTSDYIQMRERAKIAQARVDVLTISDREKTEVLDQAELVQRGDGVWCGTFHVSDVPGDVEFVPIPEWIERRKQWAKALAEARKDSVRLEAVVGKYLAILHFPSHKDGPWHIYPAGSGPFSGGKRLGVGETPRAAIDSAMAKGTEK